MAYNTKKLLTDRNGDPIPQSYDSDGDRYVPSEIDARLKAIENQQQEILERLDGTFDTQLTGSNVEQDVNVKNYPDTQKVEVTNQQEIPSVEFPSDYPDSKASERLGVIEQQQAKILDRLNNEEGLPIINQGNSFGVNLLDEGEIGARSSKTVATSRDLDLSGVTQLTVYVASSETFTAVLYVYDYVNNNLVRNSIEIADNQSGLLSRPSYITIDMPVTKRIAVIVSNKSDVDMSSTVNIGFTK